MSLPLVACGNESGASDGSGNAGGRAGGAMGGTAGDTGGAPLAGAGLGGGGAANGGSGTTGAAGGGAMSGAAGTSGAAAGGAAGGGGESGSGAGTAGASGMAGSSSGGGAGAGAGGAAGMGGTASDATIVPDPSWTCGMPEGIPAPEGGELLFEASLELGEIHDVGMTQFGQRRVLDVDGGTVEGQRVNASVLAGGIDFELTLSNDAAELEQVLVLRSTDGALVYVRNCGVVAPGASGGRLVFDFEAPSASSLAFLNSGKFVGTRSVDEGSGAIVLRAYDVSDLTAGTSQVELVDPAGTPNQDWNCSTDTGTRGATVFTENVTLGSSLAVGASKRGTRNIIPITGGTVSGRVTGTVVPGGADYQLVGGSTTLDARYTLASNDGEFIVVRNCGPIGRLIPTFETRAAGPYAFLNENRYLSSDPGVGGGGVSITFYERQ